MAIPSLPAQGAPWLSYAQSLDTEARTIADKATPNLNTIVCLGDSYTARNRFTRATIAVSGGAGTFTVTVNGQTTPAQAFNVPLATLQTAILALTGVATGTWSVGVSGTPGTTYVIDLTSAAFHLGDTVTATGSGGATVAVTYDSWTSAQGYWTWAQVLSRHRLRTVKNAGVGGDGSAQVLARFDTDVTPFAPGWVALMVGTNDVANGATAATIQTNITAILDKIRGIGARAILSTIPPRNALTSGQRAVQVQVNRWIRDQGRARRGIHVVDTWQALVDPTTLGFATALHNGDGIHVSGLGAARVGRLMADVVTKEAPAVDMLGHSTEDPLLLSVNPFMTGTGGTLATGITGSVAAGWSTGAVTSVTATASKVARTDLVPGEWQQFNITAGTGLTLSQLNDGIGSAWVAGTQIYAVCEFETDPGFEITDSSGTFQLSVLAFNTSFVGQGSAADLAWFSGDTFEPEARPTSGVLRTPTFTVPATANKRIATQVFVKGVGTFRIGRYAFYKVA